jgi:hypothetical protein
MPRRVLPLLLFAVAAAACGASTTRFVTSWRAPDAAAVTVAGRNVVALFMGQNATTRRIAEDAMAREIVAQGAVGVPAYSVLGPDVTDEGTARARLTELGYAGLVVMRVVGTDTRTRYEPDHWARYPHYRRLWGGGFWGWGWRHVHAPGYLVEDRIVSVETLVYSLERGGELMWAGISRTVNPDRIDSFVGEVAHEASREIAKAGLLATRR